MTKDEALKLALEALEGMYIEGFTQDNSPINNALTAIRKALAEQPPCKTGSQCTSKCEQCRYKYECDKAEQPAQQQKQVKVEYWLQDTMESGRWVTTDNMARATAEKMLSGEYGDVYPQGRIVEPFPPASKPWVGLTQKDKKEIERLAVYVEGAISLTEAKLKEKNA